MTEGSDIRMHTMRAIRSSCIPLLCGNIQHIHKTARRLSRLYGIRSYALLSEKPPLLRRLFAPFCVKNIYASCTEPALLTDTAAHFFEALDPTALPVFIDCTDDYIFLGDPARKNLLECRCFLSDFRHFSEIPPFCYLEEHTRGADPAHTEQQNLQNTERSVGT